MQNSNVEQYSVLMPVYDKEEAIYLKDSIRSMMEQTLPPGEFVLVCDGELDEKLNEVIRWAERTWKDTFVCVRLEKHQGLGKALQEGLLHCKYPIVARMDSDDISCPKRCELQMKILHEGNYSIVGGSIREFRKKPGDTREYRRAPRTQEEILKYAKIRNPFNHPCVMFRKEDVLAVGNYQEFTDFEDYHLWMRMLKMGCTGYNLQEVLVHMRVGNGLYERRGGMSYARSIISFEKYMLETGYIGKIRFLCNCTVRVFMSVIPKWMRECFYHWFLR